MNSALVLSQELSHEFSTQDSVRWCFWLSFGANRLIVDTAKRYIAGFTNFNSHKSDSLKVGKLLPGSRRSQTFAAASMWRYHSNLFHKPFWATTQCSEFPYCISRIFSVWGRAQPTHVTRPDEWPAAIVLTNQHSKSQMVPSLGSPPMSPSDPWDNNASRDTKAHKPISLKGNTMRKSSKWNLIKGRYMLGAEWKGKEVPSIKPLEGWEKSLTTQTRSR